MSHNDTCFFINNDGRLTSVGSISVNELGDSIFFRKLSIPPIPEIFR